MPPGLCSQMIVVVDPSGWMAHRRCCCSQIRKRQRDGHRASIGEQPVYVPHLKIGTRVRLPEVNHGQPPVTVMVCLVATLRSAERRSPVPTSAMARVPTSRVPPGMMTNRSPVALIAAVQVPRAGEAFLAAPPEATAAPLCPSEETSLDWVPLGLAAAPQAAVWPLATFRPRPVPRLPNPHNPVCARAITPERVPGAPALQVPISLATFASVPEPSAPSEQVPRWAAIFFSVAAPIAPAVPVPIWALTLAEVSSPVPVAPAGPVPICLATFASVAVPVAAAVPVPVSTAIFLSALVPVAAKVAGPVCTDTFAATADPAAPNEQLPVWARTSATTPVSGSNNTCGIGHGPSGSLDHNCGIGNVSSAAAPAAAKISIAIFLYSVPPAPVEPYERVPAAWSSQ